MTSIPCQHQSVTPRLRAAHGTHASLAACWRRQWSRRTQTGIQNTTLRPSQNAKHIYLIYEGSAGDMLPEITSSCHVQQLDSWHDALRKKRLGSLAIAGEATFRVLICRPAFGPSVLIADEISFSSATRHVTTQLGLTAFFPCQNIFVQ